MESKYLMRVKSLADGTSVLFCFLFVLSFKCVVRLFCLKIEWLCIIESLSFWRYVTRIFSTYNSIIINFVFLVTITVNSKTGK